MAEQNNGRMDKLSTLNKSDLCHYESEFFWQSERLNYEYVLKRWTRDGSQSKSRLPATQTEVFFQPELHPGEVR
jgi:hypothetical protein